jgi:hypothetical protein
MVNSRTFTLAAVASLLIIAGCAPIYDNSGGGFSERPADIDDYQFHIYGRRAGLEPCSLVQLARHTC